MSPGDPSSIPANTTPTLLSSRCGAITLRVSQFPRRCSAHVNTKCYNLPKTKLLWQMNLKSCMMLQNKQDYPNVLTITVAKAKQFSVLFSKGRDDKEESYLP